MKQQSEQNFLPSIFKKEQLRRGSQMTQMANRVQAPQDEASSGKCTLTV